VRHFFLLSASIAAIEAAEGEETEKSLEAHRDAMARARDACFQEDDGDEEDLIGEDTEAFRAYVKAADRAIEVLGMREACEGLDERRSARDETPRDADATGGRGVEGRFARRPRSGRGRALGSHRGRVDAQGCGSLSQIVRG
jgi:hypothetical protein